ncbi:MAG: YbaB/EbfC family nucleoid-associated protein [Actinobacteria bacterium]|nr:YbaB/EbfC family nucleoid-associated protein [Actinomycetota bacterium]
MKFDNLGMMKKQVEKLQTGMARLQEELALRTVEATAGGGVVRVVVSGALELREIHIQPEVAGSGEVEMLQDLIVAAVNEGIRKAQLMASEEMAKLTGGLKIPGLP